jgi:hypothetical protein
MNEAAKRLKGHRNHRHLDDLFDGEGNVVQQGARTTAIELMEQYGEPVYINRQTSKVIETSDGRIRTTFDGYYLAFSRTDHTIEMHAPEGWVEPEPDLTGSIARERREAFAAKAKQALADVMEMAASDDPDSEDAYRSMAATWAKRIPGEAWDERLGEQS